METAKEKSISLDKKNELITNGSPQLLKNVWLDDVEDEFAEVSDVKTKQNTDGELNEVKSKRIVEQGKEPEMRKEATEWDFSEISQLNEWISSIAKDLKREEAEAEKNALALAKKLKIEEDKRDVDEESEEEFASDIEDSNSSFDSVFDSED